MTYLEFNVFNYELGMQSLSKTIKPIDYKVTTYIFSILRIYQENIKDIYFKFLEI